MCVGVSVLLAEACNMDTTPTQPQRNSNTHWTKNNTTNVVIQQNSCKLLMKDILMSKTCWAHKKWNKIASDKNLVFYSSTSCEILLKIQSSGKCHLSDNHTPIKGVNEFLPIFPHFLTGLGAMQYRRSPHNSAELLQVWWDAFKTMTVFLFLAKLWCLQHQPIHHRYSTHFFFLQCHRMSLWTSWSSLLDMAGVWPTSEVGTPMRCSYIVPMMWVVI